MQKKLLAVAVAGVLFTPLAMAQSAVTISGTFKVGIDQYSISNACESATTGCLLGVNRAGRNKSEVRVTDHSSQMHFNVTEDLGGGLAGIAKLDVRFSPDQGTLAGSGNTWVGMRSNSLGTLTFGRHDLHYGKQPDEVPVKGALMASSVSLMDYAAGGLIAVANATRTPNVIRWDSPNWSGFNLTVAYSTNPAGAFESDLVTNTAVTNRKGNAWTFNPSYTASNWQAGYSFWNSKADGPFATAPAATFAGAIGALAGMDQKSHVFYGFMRFGAFKVGAAYKRDEIESPIDLGPGIGREISRRSAWTVPVAWFAGPHTVAATYTRASKDKAQIWDGAQSSARMIALAYSYDLSKRTSVGLSYAQIRNGEDAAYDLFTNCSGGKTSAAGTNTGGFGSAGSCVNFGEDPRLLSAVLRHTF